jgi:hypothetical protein
MTILRDNEIPMISKEIPLIQEMSHRLEHNQQEHSKLPLRCAPIGMTIPKVAHNDETTQFC